MAYHVFVPDDNNPENFLFDCYLGSANTVNRYWESVGRQLGLQITSALTERADSEDGLVLSGNDLETFRFEICILEKYWTDRSFVSEMPEGLIENIEKIKYGIEVAIEHKVELMIG